MCEWDGLVKATPRKKRKKKKEERTHCECDAREHASMEGTQAWIISGPQPRLQVSKVEFVEDSGLSRGSKNPV
jgi:hypothetical protein